MKRGVQPIPRFPFGVIMGTVKTKTDEYKTFSQALGKVLKVSHSEMKAKLEAEKMDRTVVKSGRLIRSSKQK